MVSILDRNSNGSRSSGSRSSRTQSASSLDSVQRRYSRGRPIDLGKGAIASMDGRVWCSTVAAVLRHSYCYCYNNNNNVVAVNGMRWFRSRPGNALTSARLLPGALGRRVYVSCTGARSPLA